VLLWKFLELTFSEIYSKGAASHLNSVSLWEEASVKYTPTGQARVLCPNLKDCTPCYWSEDTRDTRDTTSFPLMSVLSPHPHYSLPCSSFSMLRILLSSYPLWMKDALARSVKCISTPFEYPPPPPPTNYVVNGTPRSLLTFTQCLFFISSFY
jgi:hypothetical protein